MRCWRPADAKESQSLTVCPLQTALSTYIKGCMGFVFVCVRIENQETDWSQAVTLKAAVEDITTTALSYFTALFHCVVPL